MMRFLRLRSPVGLARANGLPGRFQDVGCEVWSKARQFWQGLWQYFNGDAAYERYLRHWQCHHVGQPLSRKAFFAAETQRKWNGVKRCC